MFHEKIFLAPVFLFLSFYWSDNNFYKNFNIARNAISNSPNYQTIILLPGETKVLYYYVNLSGRIFYRIINKSGTNKINCWWVKGPFGTVQGIGQLINSGSTPSKGLLWGKLKVSGADSETTILISDQASVAINFPSIHY